MIKRIHVAYTLKVDPGADGAAIERAHEHHRGSCPVYRSIHRAIAITTSLDVVEDAAG